MDVFVPHGPALLDVLLAYLHEVLVLHSEHLPREGVVATAQWIMILLGVSAMY